MPNTLTNETIIYFGPEPWDGLWRNRHQLMSRFAKHNSVWYVEPATLLRQLISGRKSRTRLFTRDPSGVNVFHSPWWLPIIGRNPLKRVSTHLFMFVLSKVVNPGNKLPIIWYSKPEMVEYSEALPAKLSIYHVVDEYSGYGSPTDAAQQKVLKQEAAMLRNVDCAIVVTQSLLERKSQYNSNTHLVSNAVDYSAYAEGDTIQPEDMRDVPKPVVGYTGLIAARLDLELLLAAAQEKPNWSFVFVGTVNEDRCQKEIRQLRELQNVYFLGQKSIAVTPQYVRCFDVCMLPYTLDLRAEHASPLKLYEYAAASRPIVASGFSAAREFAGSIELFDSVESFVNTCERSLDANSKTESIAINLRFAANNTWDHRIEQVSDIIRLHTD